MPKLSDRYYTGREVQRKLGITEPALRNLVNQRKIRKITPPGKQYGVYLKEEIDTYEEKWLAFLAEKELPKTTFEIGKISDMEKVYDIAKRAITPGTMTAELRSSWLEANPESCYVVKHDDKVVAFFHLLPLKHECLMQFMEGKIRGWNITADNVEKFEEDKPVECLAIIASEPDVNETTRMYYVTVLLRGLRKELHKLGKRGVILTKIYATSETPTGIAMSIHAGMEAYGPTIGKRLTFILDVATSTSFLAKSYREGFSEWQKEHSQPPKTNRKNRMSPNSDQTKTPA
ncbi:MAG: helix-turn-helix domain-containing protein [Ktedonobacteraceae bacterium]|nr:helix-turn-helix domain-containing protein [Ktedonobacteraceae bacterium]